MVKVLYDGWSLVHRPNSPEALHLLALLEQRHPEVQAVVALPGEAPEWLPVGTDARVLVEPGSRTSRLAWEQRRLPGVLHQEGADLLHLTGSHPPVLDSNRTVLSPTDQFEEADQLDRDRPKGLGARIQLAASRGGMSGLRGIFWPQDLASLAPTGKKTPVYYLPPEPMPDFPIVSEGVHASLFGMGLPETYILCPAPIGEGAANRLLQSWSWAAGPIGETYPLVIFGLDPAINGYLEELAERNQLESSVRLLPSLHPGLLLPLFQNAAAIFHPQPAAAWGGFIRLVLRCGKPLVATDDPLAGALVGPAAYLAPRGNTRLLGAGLITVMVEESIAERLAEQARERAKLWQSGSFQEDLYAAYLTLLRNK